MRKKKETDRSSLKYEKNDPGKGAQTWICPEEKKHQTKKRLKGLKGVNETKGQNFRV